MDVLVKGMKMPENCAECRMLEGYLGDGICHANDMWLDNDFFLWNQFEDGEVDDSKPINCPLIEVPTWIPVSEKLPQKCQFYLVTDYSEVEKAYYDSDGVWFSPHGDKLKAVSHWMSLPEPAKEEADV